MLSGHGAGCNPLCKHRNADASLFLTSSLCRVSPTPHHLALGLQLLHWRHLGRRLLCQPCQPAAAHLHFQLRGRDPQRCWQQGAPHRGGLRASPTDEQVICCLLPACSGLCSLKRCCPRCRQHANPPDTPQKGNFCLIKYHLSLTQIFSFPS